MQLQEILDRIFEEMQTKQGYRTRGYPTGPSRSPGGRSHKRWKTRRASGRA